VGDLNIVKYFFLYSILFSTFAFCFLLLFAFCFCFSLLSICSKISGTGFGHGRT
jgi:hypothetical protein